jgi:hypothetical protein
MADDAVDQPKKGSENLPQAPEAIIEKATQLLKGLRDSIGTQTDASIQSANEAIKKAKEALGSVKDSTYVSALEKEIALIPDTILELHKQSGVSEEKIGTLQGLYETTYESLKKGAKVGVNAVKTGFQATLDGIGNGMEMIGKFFGEIWEGMKPTVKRFVDMPMFTYFLSPESLQTLKAALGYNEEMEAVEKEIRERLPNNVKFSLTLKKELTMFKDVYDKMLQKTNKSPEKYTRAMFIHDILEKYVDVKGKKEVSMLTIVTGAKKLVEDTKEVPATTTSAPVATPAAPASSATPSAPLA